MTNVSITDFRTNLAEYLRLVKYNGEKVVIVDEKIGEAMAELSPPSKTESWEEHMKFVDSMFGAWKNKPADENRKALRRSDKTVIKRRLKR